MSVKPAARAHDSSTRPAFGSPPLARATFWYSACQASRTRIPGSSESSR